MQNRSFQLEDIKVTATGQDVRSSPMGARICEIIAQHGGWIGFDRYMQEALYAPNCGYYCSSTAKLGADGDYITAPMLGQAFAACLAGQFIEIRSNLHRPDTGMILEFGAGTGQMALDMLTCLNQQSALPKRYMIIEVSGDLAGRQQQLFQSSGPEFLSIVEWVHEIPDRIRGMVLANEVLDAMPAKRFQIGNSGRIMELGVGLDGGLLAWKEGSPLEDAIAARLKHLGLPPGYRSELGLQAEFWTASLAEALEEGVALVIDYGFPRHEYFHPDRDDGTLMCHYRHAANMDPFLHPGLQDITAHLDFTAIAEAGREAGAEVAGFCSQGCFLIGAGILDLAPSGFAAPDQHTLAMTAQIKTLTLPHEMGELFKVLAFSKNYPHRLSGFSVKDIQDSL